MPTQRAPQYIQDAIERLTARVVRMERTIFGMPYDKVKMLGPVEGERVISVDELIKSKTQNWRSSWIEPDLKLLKAWAEGEAVSTLNREGSKQ